MRAVTARSPAGRVFADSIVPLTLTVQYPVRITNVAATTW
jgi:hypothetical protein